MSLPKYNKRIPYKNIQLYKFILNNCLLPRKVLGILISFFSNIFFLKKNCLLLDYENNLNYLPISNKILFDRDNRSLYKTVKFFNVNTLVFFNMNKKLFIFSKLTSYKLINISTNTLLDNNRVDINLGLPKTTFYNYLVYVIIINIYLKLNN